LSGLPSSPGGSAVSVSTLSAMASSAKSPVALVAQGGPLGATAASRPALEAACPVQATPPAPTVSPPPYTEASSSSGDGSFSPSFSEEGIADDAGDVGVMFTTRARRRHIQATGDTSGDGGASSPTDTYSSGAERRPYALRPGATAYHRRRGDGSWDSNTLLSPMRSDSDARGDSVLGLDLGKLDVLSGEDSRWSGDRGMLTTDAEDHVSRLADRQARRCRG
jgi:hypothetical protein